MDGEPGGPRSDTPGDMFWRKHRVALTVERVLSWDGCWDHVKRPGSWMVGCARFMQVQPIQRRGLGVTNVRHVHGGAWLQARLPATGRPVAKSRRLCPLPTRVRRATLGMYRRRGPRRRLQATNAWRSPASADDPSWSVEKIAIPAVVGHPQAFAPSARRVWFIINCLSSGLRSTA